MVESEKLFDLIVNESAILSRFIDPVFAQNFYAALCNNSVESETDIIIELTWREAAGLVAKIRNEILLPEYHEDYMDYYCSGCNIAGDSSFVPEGFVTLDISDAMASIGLYFDLT
jgi:hypothetical protein